MVLSEPQTEAAILAFCKERLADFKMPKKLYVVEAIPRTAPTNQVQRRLLVEWISAPPGARDREGEEAGSHG